MTEQLRIYFSLKNYFTLVNMDFQKEFHSCESALHDVISKCLVNMEKKLINLLLFIDFKKVFDLINPKLLFVKLLNYVQDNNAIK